MHTILLKTKIYSGIGSLQVLSAHRNQKAFLVCDEFLLGNGGVRQLLEAVDSSCKVRVFHKVVPGPPMDTVARALIEFQHFALQVMIALGGGSAIDTAKNVLYFSEQVPGGSDVGLIAMPTTNSTGSEMASVNVLTGEGPHARHMIVDDGILLGEAILDVRLVLLVPPHITANTGADILTHTPEAYVGLRIDPFSDVVVEKAVELVYFSLLTCYSSGGDLEARTQMHEVSTSAEVTFNKAGLGFSHALVHSLDGVFYSYIPYGLANTLVLEEVILFSGRDPATCARYIDLARRTGIPVGTKSDRDAVWDLIRYVEDLESQMKISDMIRDCGIFRKGYDRSLATLTLSALKDWSFLLNPVRVAVKDMVKTLSSTYQSLLCEQESTIIEIDALLWSFLNKERGVKYGKVI